MSMVPPTLYEGRRRRVRLSEQPLTEAEREQVARDVAAALQLGSHHGSGDPWVDPYETRVRLEEELAWHLTRVDELRRHLAGATAADLDRYNPDDRDADRQDARDREAAQDEAAIVDAPRLAAS